MEHRAAGIGPIRRISRIGQIGRKSRQPKRLRPSGGYRKLRSFQVTTIIYDATVSFCDRFVDKRSRTVDQMVQAARSGRQNIAEGSRASATSSQTELRLVNVARASLDELLLDYEDFLRQRGLPQWAKDDPQAQAVREVGKRMIGRIRRIRPIRRIMQLMPAWLDHADPAVVANALICLIHQANYLLDQQIAALEREFVEGGGYSEQLAAARIAERQRRRTIGPIRRIRPIESEKRPGLPALRKANGPAHCTQRDSRRFPVLGMLGLPGVQGHKEIGRIRPISPIRRREAMSIVGQIEKKTQQRVVKLFREQLGVGFQNG